MTRARRPRLPSQEDRALWDEVSRTVRPLKRRPDADAAAPAPTQSDVKRPAAADPAKPVPMAKTTEPPRLAPLDRRFRSRIGKGTVTIDARVDLHGLTQAAAHQRLHRFLAESQAAGARLVLVITGKGRPGGEQAIGEGRGVLRRLVPMWLASAELRRYVVGYDGAGRGHGGEGALYVRIRSSRKGSA